MFVLMMKVLWFLLNDPSSLVVQCSAVDVKTGVMGSHTPDLLSDVQSPPRLLYDFDRSNGSETESQWLSSPDPRGPVGSHLPEPRGREPPCRLLLFWVLMCIDPGGFGRVSIDSGAECIALS